MTVTAYHRVYRTPAYARRRAPARGMAILTVFLIGLVVLRLAGDNMQLALAGGGVATVAVLAAAVTASIYTDRRNKT